MIKAATYAKSISCGFFYSFGLCRVWQSLFCGDGVPDVLCILVYRSVGGESAGAGGVHQRHRVPARSVRPELVYFVLRLTVVREVRENHVGVVIDNSSADLRELLAAEAAVYEIDDIAKLRIVVVEIHRNIALALEFIDLGGWSYRR